MAELLSGSELYRARKCLAHKRLEAEANKLGVLPPPWTLWSERGVRVHAGNPQTADEREAYEVTSRRLAYEMAQYGLDEHYCVHAEERFYLREGFEPYFTGKPDRWYAVSDSIVIGDLKPGYEADWEAWAAQMEAYAVLLYENRWDAQKKRVIGLIQTRFHGIRTWQFLPDELESLRQEIKQLALHYADELNEQAPATPGSWCRYCQARLICKAALRTPVRDYLPVESLPAGLQGADILDKLHLIIKIARDQIDWYKRRILDNPDFVDGRWKIQSRRDSFVTHTAEAINTLSASFGLGASVWEDCAKLSVTKLREAILERDPGLTQKAAKEAIESALGELLESHESQYLIQQNEKEFDN